jgi:hypothetical protein
MRIPPFYFYIFFGLCFLLALLNLDKLPVAWVDETMLIDPATTFLRTGKFASRIWPYPGTEEVFLAYLPLVCLVHIVNLSMLPWEMFFIRLPWLLFMVLTAFFLFKTLRAYYGLSISTALMILLVFICDEGISNAMRSGRVEMINLGFLSVVLYLFVKKRYPFLQTFLLSMLFLSHPTIWSIVGILMLYRIFRPVTMVNRLGHVLLFSIPVLLYLLMARFDLHAIYQQLVVHGTEHTVDAVEGNIFYKHFIDFFLPPYRVQPYIMILHLALLVYCVHRILRLKDVYHTMFEILFVATDLYWFFVLAPFYRYTPPLVYLMILLLPGFVLFFSGKFPSSAEAVKRSVLLKPLVIGFLLYVSFPFLYRNLVALAQRTERDAGKVYVWLDEHTKHSGKVLFVDASVAHFYSLQRTGVDFTLRYAVKKFNYHDYEAVYYLSLLPEPEESEFIAEYSPPPLGATWEKLASVQKITTYRGLRLYRMKSEAGMKALQAGYED